MVGATNSLQQLPSEDVDLLNIVHVVSYEDAAFTEREIRRYGNVLSDHEFNGRPHKDFGGHGLVMEDRKFNWSGRSEMLPLVEAIP